MALTPPWNRELSGLSTKFREGGEFSHLKCCYLLITWKYSVKEQKVQNITNKIWRPNIWWSLTLNSLILNVERRSAIFSLCVPYEKYPFLPSGMAYHWWRRAVSNTGAELNGRASHHTCCVVLYSKHRTLLTYALGQWSGTKDKTLF